MEEIIYSAKNKIDTYDIQDQKFELYKALLPEVLKDRYYEYVSNDYIKKDQFQSLCQNIYKLSEIAFDVYSKKEKQYNG